MMEILYSAAFSADGDVEVLGDPDESKIDAMWAFLDLFPETRSNELTVTITYWKQD